MRRFMAVHLVTGGSGFLGNLIARRLLAQGERVKILDIWEDPSRPRDIEYIECDIRNADGVRRAFQGVDVIHHNVALVPLSKSGDQFWEVNVTGTRVAAEEAVRAGVKSFIHMSSSAIFGAQKQWPITEATVPNPGEIYGRGKLAGEHAVKDICGRAGLPLIIIRPRTILGEGRLGIFQILFSWIRENRNVYVIGKGEGLFQFVHATDLMGAYMLALAQNKPGTYNVGTDRFGTLREGLEHLIAHAHSRSRVRALPEGLTVATLRALDWAGVSPLAPYHYLTYGKPYHFDVSPLHALGWKARYSNDEMFRDSYDWFCANQGKVAPSSAGGSPHRRAVREGVLRLVKRLS
jgi:nucleoside-diphosphate-sugar epimerase